jgi:hypothetical protein
VPRLRLAKGSLTISARAGTAKASASYRIGPALVKPQAAGMTDLVEATYTYAMGCPPSDGFILHVTPRAMAYEVTAGDQRWIVPDLAGESGVKDGRGVIITGDVGCTDFAIPKARPFALDFTPLFPDGSKGETYSPSCQRSLETAPDGGITHHTRCFSPSGAEFTGKVKRLR